MRRRRKIVVGVHTAGNLFTSYGHLTGHIDLANLEVPFYDHNINTLYNRASRI